MAVETRTPTRTRILEATAGLLRRQGYTGTGLKQIAVIAEAPFGSIYHFFPGGKEELGAATVRAAGSMYEQLIPAVFDGAPTLPDGIRTFFSLAAEHLEASGWQDACPIATVALETSSSSEVMRAACAAVFESWIAAGTERFRRFGLTEAQARELTVRLLCALEGGFVLARALRSREPLLVAGESLAAAAQAG
jgi:AcrR family transcriptional regulator